MDPTVWSLEQGLEVRPARAADIVRLQDIRAAREAAPRRLPATVPTGRLLPWRGKRAG